MGKVLEIRWHGRGGQGTKTAMLLLADVAFNTGKYIQGFPEYGPERMGAPIVAYNRISDERIKIHSAIYEPDYVVVVDDTLLDSIDVTAGLKKDGGIVVNTTLKPEEIRALLNNDGSNPGDCPGGGENSRVRDGCGVYQGRVYTIDAKKISMECLGKYFPNIPMLGAIVKAASIMDEKAFLEDMNESFKHKFASKPGVIDGNMKALERSLGEVMS